MQVCSGPTQPTIMIYKELQERLLAGNTLDCPQRYLGGWSYHDEGRLCLITVGSSLSNEACVGGETGHCHITSYATHAI